MIDLKMAFLNQLRKRLTDPASRATTHTETFNGTGSATDFTLTNLSLCYVDSVSISSVTQTLITDYTIDFGTGAVGAKIKFSTPPANGTGNISVTYFTGSNWIFDDYPREDAAYPRIALTNVGGAGETSGGVGDKIVILEPSFRVGIYVRTGKNYTISGENYTGSKLLDFMVTDLQNQIRNIRHNNDIGGLINSRITEPNYLGLDEEHKLKRCSCTVRLKYQKNY